MSDTSVTPAADSWAAVEIDCTLRAISWLVVDCSSEAAAISSAFASTSSIEATIWRSASLAFSDSSMPSSALRLLRWAASTAWSISDCTSPMMSAISEVAWSVSSASSRTSSATTANPWPVSEPVPSPPARAASIAAFSANRLVWFAISSMVSTTWLISSLEAWRRSMVSAVPCTSRAMSFILPVASETTSCPSRASRPPSWADWATDWTLRAFSLIVWFNSSTAAATSSACADCSSALAAIWSDDVLISSADLLALLVALITSCRVDRIDATAPSSFVRSWPVISAACSVFSFGVVGASPANDTVRSPSSSRSRRPSRSSISRRRKLFTSSADSARRVASSFFSWASSCASSRSARSVSSSSFCASFSSSVRARFRCARIACRHPSVRKPTSKMTQAVCSAAIQGAE